MQVYLEDKDMPLEVIDYMIEKGMDYSLAEDENDISCFALDVPSEKDEPYYTPQYWKEKYANARKHNGAMLLIIHGNIARWNSPNLKEQLEKSILGRP